MEGEYWNAVEGEAAGGGRRDNCEGRTSEASGAVSADLTIFQYAIALRDEKGLTSSRLIGTPRVIKCSLRIRDRRQSSGRSGGNELNVINRFRLYESQSRALNGDEEAN